VDTPIIYHFRSEKTNLRLIFTRISGKVEEIKITIKMNNLNKIKEPTPTLSERFAEQLYNSINGDRKIQEGRVILGSFGDEYAEENEDELKDLKKDRIIISYRLERFCPKTEVEKIQAKKYCYEPDFDEDERHLSESDDDPLLSAVCKFDPKKISDYLNKNKIDKNKKGSPYPPLKLILGFNKKTREIKLNGIFISKPNFNSRNHSLFEYLFENDGMIFERKKLEEILKTKIKQYNYFLNDIKIKKTIRKYLISTSKNSIKLIKSIEITDCDDIQKINNELDELKKVDNGGN